jgi:hypothetical protein
VWQAVAPGLERAGSTPLLTVVFASAAAVTLAGCFALLWLAAAVTGDPPQPRASDAAGTLREIGRVLPDRSGLTRRSARLCLCAMAALALFVAWRVGLFAPLRAAGVPDTFASFDHPFHVARAETLIASLRHGQSLRWVANHQGGYPAEFYPFGFAWVDAAIWAAAAGRLAVPIVHRIAVVCLFLAPGVLFWLMARRDGWTPIVALSAFALHVAVPGDMWAGGYGELVLVGLVGNVAAALAVMIAMVAAADAFAGSSRRAIGVAAAAAAAAIWCNPRSAIGLVVCVGAAWAVAGWRASWRGPTLRLLAIAALAALLAAPELTSLLRFRDLYYFIRYTSYGSPSDYVAASIEAVSAPAFALAMIGVIAAWILPRRYVITRTVAVALIAYAAATVIFSGADSWIQQLEATRLMPIQRLLTIYAAAVGLATVSTVAAARWRQPAWSAGVAQAVVVAALLVIYLGPERLMPFSARGLYPVQRSGVPQMATFQQVLSVAGDEAPPGTAIFVVGTAIAGHQQLWAPARLDRLFFYDEWMWYWHTQHPGPYDPERTSRFDPERIGEAFDREYLDRNAIGAVVVARPLQPTADEAPALRRVFGGTFGLYTVVDPVRVVTLAGGAPARLAIANNSITAEGTSAGGDAVIRRNWFPRWQATVNGSATPIVHTADGYMRVGIPAGAVRLELTYVLDRIDVAARVLGLLGLAALALLASGARRHAIRRAPAPLAEVPQQNA